MPKPHGSGGWKSRLWTSRTVAGSRASRGPAPGRHAESRQGRSTAVYWQHEQRRRRWRRAPSRVSGGGAPAAGAGAAPGLCQRLPLGDLREKEKSQPGPTPGPARTRPTAPLLTRASMYSILRSSAVSFSFRVASRDRHDISAGRWQ